MAQLIKTRIAFPFYLAAHACMLALPLLSGCTTLNLRGDSGEPNELSSLARQARPVDPNLEPFTFSNKARAIEANLGVGQTSSPGERL